jgi:osmoprotectant transport system ATP-binding protein
VDLDAAAIALHNVTKRFSDTGPTAVTDLTLGVPESEIVALVGPSGCGKTTTLRMINRLIEPTEGSIRVLGQDQLALPAHELRRSIGYVIQQIGLFPHHSIRRNIGAVPELLGWDRNRIDERCDELVDLVSLDPTLLDRYPAELSGGQQQRVGVARALAADPPILLMDEPYSAVDPIVRERLQDELLTLQERVHKTIVIVTHDIDEAIRLADRIAIFNIGGVVEQYDRPAQILRAPASEFVASFLGRERGLRQLALLTVTDLTTIEGPTATPSTSIANARDLAATHGVSWVAVREGTRLMGWISLHEAASFPPGASAHPSMVSDLTLHEFVAVVRPDTPVREALDVIVTSSSQMAAVVDGDAFMGFITISQIAGGLD